MNPQNHPIDNLWLALIIGSSHLHWAWFQGQELLTAWDTPHLNREIAQKLIEGNFADRLWPEIVPNPPQPPFKRGAKPLLPDSLQPSVLWLPPLKRGAGGGSKRETQPLINSPPLAIASVVPEQTQLWQNYPQAKVITLNDLPLKGLYPTLGVDRALAALGAGEKFGWPVLAIDAGTALTFTGVNEHRQLIGGAILPGFRLQLKSLWSGTASLPDVEIPPELPSRWALNTPAGIQSGVIYTIVAGVRDFITAWSQDYPQSKIVVTGGGGAGLLAYLKAQNSPIAETAIFEPHLVFWGIEIIVNR